MHAPSMAVQDHQYCTSDKPGGLPTELRQMYAVVPPFLPRDGSVRLYSIELAHANEMMDRGF